MRQRCDNHRPRCGEPDESVNHVIFECPPTLQTLGSRFDTIVSKHFSNNKCILQYLFPFHYLVRPCEELPADVSVFQPVKYLDVLDGTLMQIIWLVSNI